MYKHRVKEKKQTAMENCTPSEFILKNAIPKPIPCAMKNHRKIFLHKFSPHQEKICSYTNLLIYTGRKTQTSQT